jgi:hypothetical protein
MDDAAVRIAHAMSAISATYLLLSAICQLAYFLIFAIYLFDAQLVQPKTKHNKPLQNEPLA